MTRGDGEIRNQRVAGCASSMAVLVNSAKHKLEMKLAMQNDFDILRREYRNDVRSLKCFLSCWDF